MQEENITLNESLSCTDPHLAPVMEFQNTRGTRSPLRHTSSFTVLVPHRVVDHELSPICHLPARGAPLTSRCIFYSPLPDYDECVNTVVYARFAARSGVSNFSSQICTLGTIIFPSISDATVEMFFATSLFRLLSRCQLNWLYISMLML